MNKKIRFCTMYLPCSNIELYKDVGVIPYTLNMLYGCECTVVGCNIDVQTVDNKLKDKIALMKINYIFNKELTGIIFLLKYARKFDWINFYHGGRSVYFWSKIYHFLNPKGKVYLKLDMDFRLCEKYENDEKERDIFRKTVESVDLVSVETIAVKEKIQKYTQKDIKIICNGYQENEDDTVVQEKKDKIFITVGRLGTKQKATEILLEAFARSANYHNWTLKLIGTIEKDFENYIQQYFEKYPNLKERVKFVGEIKNRQLLYNEYRKARVFVLPSEWESFGLVVCEALSCGCRVIVSDQVPPKSEFTMQGKYGEIVKANDIDGLSEALKEETNREFNLNEMKEISEYAKRKFDWKEICKELYNFMI